MGKDSQLMGYAIHVAMIVLGLLAVMPIYILLINATRTTEQINSGFVIVPSKDAFFSSTSTLIADWDSDEESGTVRYLDLNMGKTYKEETNKKTGVLEKIAVKGFTESLQPRIAIIGDDEQTLVNFILVDGTVIFVNNGQRIKKGETLARLVKKPNIAYNWGSLTGRGFQIFQGFGNSAFISILTTVLSIYFSAMTAYGLQVYRFRGRTVLWTVIMIIIMLPSTLSIIGFFQFMSRLKLRDSYIPLIVPGIAAAATVLFLRQYMTSVLSIDLIDAARIDGANEYRIFNIIILPVMVPALAAQSIFTFVASWNNFITPFILINSDKKFTLPMLVQSLRGNIYRAEYGAIYLGIAVSLIPILIFYSFMSRFIISGLTMGGLKE
ncbi:MAG: ABC transporter permease subunit [Treponema sp.]|jgi:multiple sugar transport system permease protein|nr:ABC transporter permease subunit [Treponema sp.]